MEEEPGKGALLLVFRGGRAPPPKMVAPPKPAPPTEPVVPVDPDPLMEQAELLAKADGHPVLVDATDISLTYRVSQDLSDPDIWRCQTCVMGEIVSSVEFMKAGDAYYAALQTGAVVLPLHFWDLDLPMSFERSPQPQGSSAGQ